MTTLALRVAAAQIAGEHHDGTIECWPPEPPDGLVHVRDIVDPFMAGVAAQLGRRWPPAEVIE